METLKTNILVKKRGGNYYTTQHTSSLHSDKENSISPFERLRATQLFCQMGRNLSPVLRRELENLDKDADSRKSAMKALKSYVKDLDSKAIPIFLAQVSETKETGLTSGEYTISLYEVLARVHGTKIVPQIPNIMSTILKTLASTAASFPLHQACSKVVPAIARYGIDPTTPDLSKCHIIHSLCKPLSDALLASQENLSSGAALCLKALVDSDNWRYASSEMVNEVCQRVAAALDKLKQVNSHMALVMALAKHNGLVMEAYARLLIRSGVAILNMGVAEGSSQKRFSAIQMVNFLMRSLDYKCIMSELSFVIEEMDKCHNDEMAYVNRAALEAIQTAKRMLIEKGSRHERRRDQSPVTMSPRSQTMDSYDDYASVAYSPFSISFTSRDEDSNRSINRKLWRRYEDGNVDVSLKDGLFSGEMGTPRSVIENSEHSEGDYADGFSGFLPSRSATPSPQRSRSYVNVNNEDFFTSPTELVKPLQVPNGNCSDNRSRMTKFNWSPTSNCDEKSDLNESWTNEDDDGASESVSSTEDIPIPPNGNWNGNPDLQLSQELGPETKVKSRMLSGLSIVCAAFVVLMAVVWWLWIQDLDEGYNLVPT